MRFAVVLLALVIGLASTGVAKAHKLYRQQASIQVLHRIDHAIQGTHDCQKDMGINLTRSAGTYRKQGMPYRYWALSLWNKRSRVNCNKLKQVRRANENWFAAAVYANIAYRGSYEWIIDCSRSEGGHTIWVPNRQGSGASGWLQFKESTFYSHVDRAFAIARSRGLLVLNSWRSWYSRAGQALTGAHMFEIGMGDSPTFVGAGCQKY